MAKKAKIRKKLYIATGKNMMILLTEILRKQIDEIMANNRLADEIKNKGL